MLNYSNQQWQQAGEQRRGKEVVEREGERAKTVRECRMMGGGFGGREKQTETEERERERE